MTSAPGRRILYSRYLCCLQTPLENTPTILKVHQLSHLDRRRATRSQTTHLELKQNGSSTPYDVRTRCPLETDRCLPSGRVIKNPDKSSSGFDTELFIRAEGTLGIELRFPLPPLIVSDSYTIVAAVHFPNIRKATEAIIQVTNHGLGIRMSVPFRFPLP